MIFNKKIILPNIIILLVLSGLVASQVSRLNFPVPDNEIKNPVSDSKKTNDTIIQIIEEDSISEEDLSENDSIIEIFEDSISVQEADSISKILQKNEDSEDEEIKGDKEIIDIAPSNFGVFKFSVPTNENPLTKNISAPFFPQKGLANRHIALWQSHGLYYKQSMEKWIWQRANIFQTREDLFTQSYILPFLVPMLENSGANVLLPRERDVQTVELIIDNDKSSTGSTFMTTNGLYDWKKGNGVGFANHKETYKDGENPFRTGTYVETTSVSPGTKESTIEWQPDFPKTDHYAVYISYKTLPNSCKNAIYTIHHTGGETKFAVNQKMGGATWIYLGNFLFEKGKNQSGKITLSNTSSDINKTITADAIKIGGGMGNISRKRSDLVTKKIIKIPIRGKKRKKYKTAYKYKYVGKGKHKKRKRVKVRIPVKRYKTKTLTNVKHFYDYSTSNMPRFTEGSRYWLQWAGIPDSIYSRTKSGSDYSDDFQSRGYWVNYLSGGSVSNPGSNGLNIPIDLSFALHTDAGKTTDSVMGTLAIHTVRNNGGVIVYKNGVSRWVGRDLADKIQTQFVNDVRATYDNTWTRRGLWNKSYSESRVAEVPSMILELLSHDNFPDMQYGQDPRFRFLASRAIYKGMLRFISEQNGTDCVVQPLPVESFSAQLKDSAMVSLKWESVEDPLEKTAIPNGYIIYTKIDNGGFNNGEFVNTNSIIKKIDKNKIYSFKVEAVNDGGRSFPSEVLSVCKTNSDTTILIINAFNRISAPATFNNSTIAGFNNDWDAGVPYMNDYKTTGFQTEFRKGRPYLSDESPGLGTSKRDLEGKIIAGNTFDYPSVHGKSIQKAGYSFVSCSEKSIENKTVKMSDYQAVDIILGKERQWTTLKKNSTEKVFKTFTPEMRKAMVEYSDEGGNFLISGAHVASDLSIANQTTAAEYGFLVHFLKFKWVGFKENGVNEVDILNVNHFNNQSFTFYSEPNKESYYVEAPDALEPTDKNAVKIGEYKNSGLCAGILYNGSYNICTFGFPIETIKEEKERDKLIQSSLNFLFKEKKKNKKRNK